MIMIQLIILSLLRVWIKMSKKKYNYILMLRNGDSYFADTLWDLFVEIVKHRAWHMKKGEGWVD